MANGITVFFATIDSQQKLTNHFHRLHIPFRTLGCHLQGIIYKPWISYIVMQPQQIHV